MNGMIEQFHFLRPAWLIALLALPLLLWAWRRTRAASEPWRRVCDPHLLAQLLDPSATRPARLPRVLFAIGFALAVLAMAGPAFRQLPQTLARAESGLVVALDLSERMRATDLKPDRLSRARFKIADLLKARKEGQTALIAYAGDAFVVAPLTDDAASLADLLASLTPETMPVGGQRAGRAITLGRRLLRDAGFARGDVLLVTDAADAAASDAAAAAAAAGVRVSVLGVGTAAGAPVALPQGGFAQDGSGNLLLPRLDEPALRDLAAAGDGRYATLTIDATDLRELALADIVADDARLRDDERTQAEYRDEGPWLLLPLLPLAALAFRRGWLTCVALVLLLPVPQARAFDLESLWKREDQRAWEALQAEDAQRALELAEDAAIRGSAAYRAQDFAQAESAFAQGSGADAHYNRGNALAKAQRFDEAIAAYDEALRLDPDMEDARANRQAIEDWKKQQEQQQQQQQQQSGENEGEEQSQDGDSSQQEPGESGQDQPRESESESTQQNQQSGEGEPQQESGSPQDSAADQAQRQAQEQFAEQMEQALKEGTAEPEPGQAEALDPREAEQRQAVEQWLRRVPDDPGGLLRRKFALEYQRRLREGGDER
jgi:Ca-activated chloride channel family protein